MRQAEFHVHAAFDDRGQNQQGGAGDFYGRDAHISLIRENRLIAGVNFIGELPAKMRQSVLLIKDKVGKGATADDARTLAMYAGLVEGTVGFTDFVQGAVSGEL